MNCLKIRSFIRVCLNKKLTVSTFFFHECKNNDGKNFAAKIVNGELWEKTFGMLFLYIG